MYTGHQGRIPKLGLKIQSNPETHYRKTYKAHAQNEEQLQCFVSNAGRQITVPTKEKSLSFQIFMSIIECGYLISHTMNAAISRTPTISRTRT
jgi:hypothetical protein